MSKGTYNDFLDALGQRESGGKYNITNWAGYLGKYQVGEAALVDSGYFKSQGSPFDNNFIGTWTGKNGITNKHDFLTNPNGQESAIRDYMKVQWRYLNGNSSTKYVGESINGIKITPSGLLGASHLVGQGAIRKYLQSDGKNITKDGNGVSLEEYLKKFGGYDTPFTQNKTNFKGQSTGQATNLNDTSSNPLQTQEGVLNELQQSSKDNSLLGLSNPSFSRQVKTVSDNRNRGFSANELDRFKRNVTQRNQNPQAYQFPVGNGVLVGKTLLCPTPAPNEFLIRAQRKAAAEGAAAANNSGGFDWFNFFSGWLPTADPGGRYLGGSGSSFGGINWFSGGSSRSNGSNSNGNVNDNVPYLPLIQIPYSRDVYGKIMKK